MELKLQVPWRTEPLPVNYARTTDSYHIVIDKMIRSGSPHIRTEGDDVLVENFFGVNNKVPDVSRYRIDSKWQPICDLEVPESRLQLQTQPGSIVLLLESPSVDEYRCGNINWPIAPAKGKSGENIDRCLGKLLSGIQAGHFVPGSHVIISNPIQFQTNLRAIHRQSTTQKTGSSKWKTLRNNVWKTLWYEGEGGVPGYIQLCFRARLNTYRPSLIVNACTGDLQNLVTNFVQTEWPKVPLYKAHHPADTSWKNCGDMGLVRVQPPDNPIP